MSNPNGESNSTDDPKAQLESIKYVNPYGAEYWSVRDLAPLLGYKNWERVPDLIERAKAACENMGQTVEDHFRGASKMVTIGSRAQREVDDYVLSRFGCYLFAMNGDPRKPEIAAAQAYFLVQTRRMEQWDELRETLEQRVEQRQQLSAANKQPSAANKQLDATAQANGLNSRSFGRLHDAGTRGLYGDLSVAQVKALKGIGQKEDHADRMGLAELAANLFVRTQTEEKIRNEEIRGTDAIVDAHYSVGGQTRDVIERIGGTKPEALPAEPSIRPLLDQRERQRKKAVAQQSGPSLFDALPAPDADGHSG